MRRKFLIWAVIILFIIFISSFFSQIFPRVFINNLILIYLLSFLILLNIKWQTAWKMFLVGGVITDIFLFLPLGLSLFSFVLAGTVAYYLKEKVFPPRGKNIFFPLLLLSLSAIAVNLMLVFLWNWFFYIFNPANIINFSFNLELIFINILTGLVFFAFIFFVNKKIAAFLRVKPDNLVIKK